MRPIWCGARERLLVVDVTPLAIPDVLELRPPKFGDDRGFFSETWSERSFDELGLQSRFVQDNHSRSSRRGVLRGLHYQVAPAAQAKLVRVTRGSIFDVAVDLRQSSPTFRRWVGLTVSAELWNQIFVPVGFAHGFVTLEDDTEVQYKITAPYRPDLERVLRWNDPETGIDWPVEPGSIQLSPKDEQAPLFSDATEVF
jgi:dTDP-4-dehydrorhamnose 3,5-epimerase